MLEKAAPIFNTKQMFFSLDYITFFNLYNTCNILKASVNTNLASSRELTNAIVTGGFYFQEITRVYHVLQNTDKYLSQFMLTAKNIHGHEIGLQWFSNSLLFTPKDFVKWILSHF